MPTLYLVRHAIAADPRPGQSDADRPLTGEGIKKFRRAARGILTLWNDDAPKLILTSPLLRARQTAELLADAMLEAKFKTELRLCPALGPAGELAGLLREAGTADAVAVGHEPILSQWIAHLCFHAPGDIEFKKGALAAIQLPAPGATKSGKLLYLIQPSALRKL